MYIWQLTGWPHFQWSDKRLVEPLARARYQQGLLLGQMKELGFDLREEASLKTLTQDVVKTSEIEGERLDPAQVRSSIARRLGMHMAGLVPADRHVEGIVELMLDATRNFATPLTKERLFDWHASLFPTGRSGMRRVIVGAWRDDRKGPMEVVSGPIGKEKTHFTAPPADRIDAEIRTFLAWFENRHDVDPVLRAAVAHLWLVTIHPFEDGNGRIARAVADMALARAEETPQRFYSMSSQIRQEGNAYYEVLERIQKGTLDISEWLEWFLECFSRAITNAREALGGVLTKARFWEKHRGKPLNERQVKVLNELLDGFEGKLTTSKWAAMTRSSQDTAYRDVLELVEHGILKKDQSGGRSTSYSLTEG